MACTQIIVRYMEETVILAKLQATLLKTKYIACEIVNKRSLNTTNRADWGPNKMHPSGMSETAVGWGHYLKNLTRVGLWECVFHYTCSLCCACEGWSRHSILRQKWLPIGFTLDLECGRQLSLLFVQTKTAILDVKSGSMTAFAMAHHGIVARRSVAATITAFPKVVQMPLWAALPSFFPWANAPGLTRRHLPAPWFRVLSAVRGECLLPSARCAMLVATVFMTTAITAYQGLASSTLLSLYCWQAHCPKTPFSLLCSDSWAQSQVFKLPTTPGHLSGWCCDWLYKRKTKWTLNLYMSACRRRFFLAKFSTALSISRNTECRDTKTGIGSYLTSEKQSQKS